MKKQRGGKRKGAGRKPGSVKPHAEKRVVRKLYQWTPDEYERITLAVQKAETIESKFVQSAVLEKVVAVMADGEQRVAADEKPLVLYVKNGGRPSSSAAKRALVNHSARAYGLQQI